MLAVFDFKGYIMKKYFIVSDIHANYSKLIKALKTSGFDLDNPDHVFVFGGDALDRGKEGDKVIGFIESLIEKNRIIGVLGNHDKFLLDMVSGDVSYVRFNVLRNGFGPTVRLGEESNRFNLTKDEFIIAGQRILAKYPVFVNWLRELPPYLEFPHHVLVHGYLDFSLDDWHETDMHYAIWERGYSRAVPESFHKKIIIGHTPNMMIMGKHDIVVFDKKILIDGGAAYGGQINVLVLDESEI